LNAGAWLRRVRFVIISPVPRHHRRVQAEIPLIPVFEFGQPPLNARFEVLSDVDCGIGLAAGIIFRVPKLYRARIEAAGINFSQRHGNYAWFLPAPATFIVDRDGRIAWRFLDADFTHRAEPADIIEAVRSLSNGEC
jgi:hypothetical protein